MQEDVPNYQFSETADSPAKSGYQCTSATYHDDQTMTKVYQALIDTGLIEQQAMDAINSMQNAGIYFRERTR